MNNALATEIKRIGGDTTDDVWRWLVLNGPHGPSFSWGQRRHNPPGYVGVEHLQRIIEEKNDIDSTFSAKAIAVVDKALSSSNENILRRAIQVAAVIGGLGELQKIKSFTSHENDSIASDAKASVFFLKRKLRFSSKRQ